MATIHGTVEGTALVASATAIVLPGNVVYVIDSGRAGLASPVFDAAKTAQPGIVNGVPDQAYTGGASWGTAARTPPRPRPATRPTGTRPGSATPMTPTGSAITSPSTRAATS